MKIDIDPKDIPFLKGIQMALAVMEVTTSDEDDRLQNLVEQMERHLPNPNHRKVRMKCTDCVENGNEDGGSPYWDASTYWDEESQQFESDGSPSGDSFCGECGAESSHAPYDIKTNERLVENIYGDFRDQPFITLEENEKLKAAYFAKSDARRQAQKDEDEAIAIANLLAADQEQS